MLRFIVILPVSTFLTPTPGDERTGRHGAAFQLDRPKYFRWRGAAVQVFSLSAYSR
jgi:hypothetical protein